MEKNSDKLQNTSVPEDHEPPVHLHELLASLQKHLLAYCHINSSHENLVSWVITCRSHFVVKYLLNSSYQITPSINLLRKHLLQMLPLAVDILRRSERLIEHSLKSQGGAMVDKIFGKVIVVVGVSFV